MEIKQTENNTETHKISFWQFLFRIGDDYLTFLRNLTPAMLFLSLSLFLFGRIDQLHFNFDGGMLFFFSLSSAFIACTVMLINIVGFSKKTLKVLHALHHQNESDIETANEEVDWAMFKQIWRETNAKQFIFFLTVNIVAVFMVLVFGLRYALSFYSSIGALTE